MTTSSTAIFRVDRFAVPRAALAPFMARLRDTLDDCIGCGCLSIDRCRLRNPADRLAAEGAGPRRLLVRPATR